MKLFSKKLLIKKATELLTFTIESNPSDALVVLTATGYTQVGNSISVPYNTSVDWSVSKNEYVSQNGTQVITSTTTRVVTLEKTSKTPLYVMIKAVYDGKATPTQYYANDLINWTQNTTYPLKPDSYLDRFMKCSNKFIIEEGGSSVGNYYYTINGQDWSQMSFPNNVTGIAGVANNIIFAMDRSSSNLICYKTTDAVNWTVINQIQSGNKYGPKPYYCGNRYFFVGYTSLDGDNWEQSVNGLLKDVCLTYNGNFFLSTTADGMEIKKSYDGKNWETLSKSLGFKISRVIFNEDNSNDIIDYHVRCAQISDGNTTHYAVLYYDGNDWEICETPNVCYVAGIINGKIIICVEEDSYLKTYSPNTNSLLNFTENHFVKIDQLGGTPRCYSRISYKGGYYIQDYTLYTRDNYIYYSKDLISWNKISTQATQIEYGELDV